MGRWRFHDHAGTTCSTGHSSWNPDAPCWRHCHHHPCKECGFQMESSIKLIHFEITLSAWTGEVMCSRLGSMKFRWNSQILLRNFLPLNYVLPKFNLSRLLFFCGFCFVWPAILSLWLHPKAGKKYWNEEKKVDLGLRGLVRPLLKYGWASWNPYTPCVRCNILKQGVWILRYGVWIKAGIACYLSTWPDSNIYIYLIVSSCYQRDTEWCQDLSHSLL